MNNILQMRTQQKSFIGSTDIPIRKSLCQLQPTQTSKLNTQFVFGWFMFERLFFVWVFAFGALTTSSFAQTTKFAPNGDTLTLALRVADWRVGGFMAGEVGIDLGKLQLPMDLNNASRLGLYENTNFGAASAMSVGVEGCLHVAPRLTTFARLGFAERNGYFSLLPPSNPAGYERLIATTHLCWTFP
jgi:hypothetical protein